MTFDIPNSPKLFYISFFKYKFIYPPPRTLTFPKNLLKSASVNPKLFGSTSSTPSGSSCLNSPFFSWPRANASTPIKKKLTEHRLDNLDIFKQIWIVKKTCRCQLPLHKVAPTSVSKRNRDKVVYTSVFIFIHTNHDVMKLEHALICNVSLAPYSSVYYSWDSKTGRIISTWFPRNIAHIFYLTKFFITWKTETTMSIYIIIILNVD